uniref:Putative NAC domain class transcription factor n=1 Tax=Tamarix hispida TaxID=189793 RepID=T2CBH8_9CARY|nr:putative NAC domain class transcription factor [Tamarix hispida]
MNDVGSIEIGGRMVDYSDLVVMPPAGTDRQKGSGDDQYSMIPVGNVTGFHGTDNHHGEAGGGDEELNFISNSIDQGSNTDNIDLGFLTDENNNNNGTNNDQIADDDDDVDHHEFSAATPATDHPSFDAVEFEEGVEVNHRLYVSTRGRIETRFHQVEPSTTVRVQLQRANHFATADYLVHQQQPPPKAAAHHHGIMPAAAATSRSITTYKSNKNILSSLFCQFMGIQNRRISRSSSSKRSSKGNGNNSADNTGHPSQSIASGTDYNGVCRSEKMAVAGTIDGDHHHHGKCRGGGAVAWCADTAERLMSNWFVNRAWPSLTIVLALCTIYLG